VAVPWNESYFPHSMVNLAPIVRAKAIEIANALLAEGYEEGRAIRIAIAQAKRWANRRLLEEAHTTLGMPKVNWR